MKYACYHTMILPVVFCKYNANTYSNDSLKRKEKKNVKKSFDFVQNGMSEKFQEGEEKGKNKRQRSEKNLML